MMNYKMEMTGEWADTPSITNPGAVSGYGHMTYEVIETHTDQVIKSALSGPEAKSLVRHLNLGGGFDGKTPAFFLDAFPLSKNIDDF